MISIIVALIFLLFVPRIVIRRKIKRLKTSHSAKLNLKEDANYDVFSVGDLKPQNNAFRLSVGMKLAKTFSNLLALLGIVTIIAIIVVIYLVINGLRV